MERAFRLVYILAIVAFLALLGISIGGLWDANVVWDDSYMFVRYADHFLAGQGISWNPGEGPVYGLTSLGYFLVIVLFRALLPGQAALTAMLASLSGALVFIILMFILLGRAIPAGGKAKQAIRFFIIGSLGLSIDPWRVHCLDGMDTTFALAWLTLYFLIAKWRQQAPRPAGAVIMGIVGGLSYWARPDLCLYAGLIPLVMLVLERDRRARKLSVLTLVITGALTGGGDVVLILVFPHFPAAPVLCQEPVGLRRLFRAAVSVPSHHGTADFHVGLLVLLRPDRA